MEVATMAHDNNAIATRWFGDPWNKRREELKGILPICSFCKKIRNDEGYWEQVELYVRERSAADFSHGLCPVCAKKHYPELAE